MPMDQKMAIATATAKKVAEEYFNKFQKFPEYKNKTDNHLYKLAIELMKFSITGDWNVKD